MLLKTDNIYHQILHHCFSFSNRRVLLLINNCFGTCFVSDSLIDTHIPENINIPQNQPVIRVMVTVNRHYHYQFLFQMPAAAGYYISHAAYLDKIKRHPLIPPESIMISLSADTQLSDTYDLPVCFFYSMTLREIAETHMLLLPLYLLKLYTPIIVHHSMEAIESLKQLIIYDIPDLFHQQLAEDQMTIHEVLFLQDLLLKLYDHLYAEDTGEYILTDIFNYKIAREIKRKNTVSIIPVASRSIISL